jgi:hypothetical protein
MFFSTLASFGFGGDMVGFCACNAIQCNDELDYWLGSGVLFGRREPLNQKTTSLSTEHCIYPLRRSVFSFFDLLDFLSAIFRCLCKAPFTSERNNLK